MHQPASFNAWSHYGTPPSPTVDIKVEPASMDTSAFALLSPPSSPSLPGSVSSPRSTIPSSISNSLRRASTSGSTASKRVKPYTAAARETKHRADCSVRMSDSPYSTWPGMKAGSPKVHPSLDRRSSDGNQQYSLADAFIHSSSSRTSSNRTAQRAQTSSSSMHTSSLTGAMGDNQISSQSMHSESPSPPLYLDTNAAVVWSTNQPQSNTHTGYPTVPNHASNIAYHTLPPSAISSSSGQYIPYPDYNTSSYHNQSSDAHSPNSPAYGSPYNEQSMFPATRTVIQRNHVPTVPVLSYDDPSSSSSTPHPLRSRPTPLPVQEHLDDEARFLRRRVKELELIHESARHRIRELEAELARDAPLSQPGPSSASVPSSSPSGGPGSVRHLSPLSTPSPLAMSPSFQASWKARTDARIRQFCSLNRAGNALCAWHDSRRERRAYPPRMAPPGYLNCGCTYEEALFEESLARHNVGSYHPGESVRMDPALRNPLLQLLQRRYGYRDGDFERDPTTGAWVEGEGHQYWEQRVLAGPTHSRRAKPDERR